jgi:hypothetical protein
LSTALSQLQHIYHSQITRTALSNSENRNNFRTERSFLLKLSRERAAITIHSPAE